MLSGSLVKGDGVSRGIIRLVSSLSWGADEAVISAAPGETAVVVPTIPLALVPVSDVFADAGGTVSVLRVGTEALGVTVAVTVVFRAVATVRSLSVPPVESPLGLAGAADARGPSVAPVVPPYAASLGSLVLRSTMSLDPEALVPGREGGPVRMPRLASAATVLDEF